MVKLYFIAALLFLPMLVINAQKDEHKSIYQFTVDDINGESFSFAELKGKKIMIVNTASKCGLTPQYDKLEEIYQKYKDNNFIIIAFPSNDFMGQEPGTNEEILEFCTLNYNVSFPIMSKVIVKGDEICEIYRFLTSKRLNAYRDSKVKWNFQKYLINEEGELVEVIDPSTEPDAKEIIDWIES